MSKKHYIRYGMPDCVRDDVLISMATILIECAGLITESDRDLWNMQIKPREITVEFGRAKDLPQFKALVTAAHARSFGQSNKGAA